MKKGDKVQMEIIYPAGIELFTGCASPADVTSAMNRSFVDMYSAPAIVSYKIEVAKGSNAGSWCAVTLSPFISVDTRIVNWVVDNTASLASSDGMCSTVENANEWKVIEEAIPSFQSELDSMSEEELKAGLADLRLKRQSAMVQPRASTKTVAMALTPEQKKIREAMKKMTPENRARVEAALANLNKGG